MIVYNSQIDHNESSKAFITKASNKFNLFLYFLTALNLAVFVKCATTAINILYWAPVLVFVFIGILFLQKRFKSIESLYGRYITTMLDTKHDVNSDSQAKKQHEKILVELYMAKAAYVARFYILDVINISVCTGSLCFICLKTYLVSSA